MIIEQTMNKTHIQLKSLITKELRIYFNSPIAYIFVVALLGFSFWYFFRNFFLVGQADMRSFFDLMPWIFIFLIPALTMRLWSEEIRQGTIEVLLTSSVPLYITVLGKYLASMIFLLISLVLTLVLPISISTIGNLDWGAVLVAYKGTLLLGSVYITIGLLISSLTRNQIVAFILTVVISFALFILSQPVVIFSLPASIVPVIDFVSFGSHYGSIIRGVIDSRDVFYYLSFTILLLYINTLILSLRR